MLEPDKRRISQEVAAILEADAPVSTAEAESEGLKDSFCEYWPPAKQALEFLKKWVPEDYKKIIAKLIRAGDFVYDQLCG